MKKSFSKTSTALLTLLLMASALHVNAQQGGPSASNPVADVGGPYIAAADSEVVFDASKSTGAIASYAWDFGDGATGSGKTTKHAYAKEGSYRVTLTVIDDQGRSDVSSSGVFVEPYTLHLDVSADPRKDRYDYGDVITGIEVTALYSDGKPAEGEITGLISGRERIPLAFKEEGGGGYRADVNYPIVKGESEFINITVNARDARGETASFVKKLTIVPSYTGSVLMVQKPAVGRFAYGEKIDFQVSFYRLKDRKGIDEGEVILYEGWSGRAFAFRREGKDYLLTYEIPMDAGDSLHYTVYGSGLIVDTRYDTVSDLGFDITHKLAVDVVYPDNDTYAPDVREIKLKLSYPDGSIVPDERVNAFIGNESLVLERSGELFAANYTPPENKSEISLWLFDGLGNGGGAKIKLSTVRLPAKDADSSLASQLMYTLSPVIALLIVLFLAYRFVEGRHRDKASLMKEYEESRQKIASLKTVTNNVMSEYYTRKITEEDARKRVLDCEKELVIERRRLKDVMEKLGMKPVDGEDKDGPAGPQKNKEKQEN